MSLTGSHHCDSVSWRALSVVRRGVSRLFDLVIKKIKHAAEDANEKLEGLLFCRPTFQRHISEGLCAASVLCEKTAEQAREGGVSWMANLGTNAEQALAAARAKPHRPPRTALQKIAKTLLLIPMAAALPFMIVISVATGSQNRDRFFTYSFFGMESWLLWPVATSNMVKTGEYQVLKSAPFDNLGAAASFLLVCFAFFVVVPAIIILSPLSVLTYPVWQRFGARSMRSDFIDRCRKASAVPDSSEGIISFAMQFEAAVNTLVPGGVMSSESKSRCREAQLASAEILCACARLSGIFDGKTPIAQTPFGEMVNHKARAVRDSETSDDPFVSESFAETSVCFARLDSMAESGKTTPGHPRFHLLFQPQTPDGDDPTPAEWGMAIAKGVALAGAAGFEIDKRSILSWFVLPLAANKAQEFSRSGENWLSCGLGFARHAKSIFLAESFWMAVCDIVGQTAEADKMLPEILRASTEHEAAFISDGWDDIPLKTHALASTSSNSI